MYLVVKDYFMVRSTINCYKLLDLALIKNINCFAYYTYVMILYKLTIYLQRNTTFWDSQIKST